MPYLTQKAREAVEGRGVQSAGDFCYVICALADEIIVDQGKSFQTMSQIIAEIECAKLELYRRLLAPYEDEKCEANGDVFYESSADD